MARRQLYQLTNEDRAQLGDWARSWIANAMSVAPMTNSDRAAMVTAIHGLYASANLPAPKHIVFVPSPFVLRLAGGFAAWRWYLHHHHAVMRDAVEAATRNATEDATLTVTEAATFAATRAATEDATFAATEAATFAATEAATFAATEDATLAATEDATLTVTEAATRAATEATEDAARAAMFDATFAAVLAATEAATRTAATRDLIRTAVLDVMRSTTFTAALAATEATTRDVTEDATEDAAKAAAEAATDQWYFVPGLHLMPALAKQLGVGDAGLRCAQLARSMWQGGNQWSAWDSFLSFFRHVVHLNLDYSHWQHWESASLHGGPRIMHSDFCMISDRPERLLVDAQNRPHCDDGPFCRWRDGSALYAVHGVRVPAWIVEDPRQITPAVIDNHPNAEIRRVMVERYDAIHYRGAYLRDSGAELVHQDAYGRLWRKLRLNDTSLMMVEVQNTTPHPDGSQRTYFLRVNPQLRPMRRQPNGSVEFGSPQALTARNAVASTFGRRGEDYAPLVES